MDAAQKRTCDIICIYGNQKAGETSDLTDSHKGVETYSIVISSQ